MDLDKRAEDLLRMLIAKFIEQGDPVGSRTLAHEPGVDLSPATVRNVMADLEDLGLIMSPHTSAGRIPTAKGYRFFIDSLLNVQPLGGIAISQIEDRLNEGQDTKELMMTVSEFLSEVTKFAGVVILPNMTGTTFRQIEFVKISAKRVLVVLITEDGRVQNRVILDEQEYSENELISAANYFNDKHRGKSLSVIRNQLLREMQRDSEEINKLMETAISMASRVIDCDDYGSANVLVSGEEQLLDVPDLAAVEKIRKIFETFRTRHSLLNLLDKSIKARGVSIFIGDESGFDGLNDCSVVAAPYEVEGEKIGVIGVIGPTRMQYERVIPVVDVTAVTLSNALMHLSHE